jgi:hypothetical protein
VLCESDSLLQRILREHWPQAKAIALRSLPENVVESACINVEKALRCRTDECGFACFVCDACGAKHAVHFSCKSRFCPGCGKARAAEAATLAGSRLLNVEHQHLTYSVPSELRWLLFADRSLLAIVAKAAATATIHAMGTRCKAHAPLPGIMATVHTYGRDLSWHVHVHVLVTRGGLRADGVWQPIKLFPAAQYRRLWQHYLLILLRKRLKCRRGPCRMIGSLYRKYPTGFIVNVMSHYRSGRKAAAYCCRYTGRPPLSERRIIGYDGKSVTIAYTDYRDKIDKQLTLPAAKFLVRLLQHVWPRYMRDVHYYGLYQPARRKLHVDAVAKASRYSDQVRPALPISRRERLIIALSESPRKCPDCGGTLRFYELHLPTANQRHAKNQQTHDQRTPGQLALRV